MHWSRGAIHPWSESSGERPAFIQIRYFPFQPVFFCDDSCSYGPQAPTKSSSKPKLVDDLDGCHVIMARMGLCCSVILVDSSSQTPEGAKMRQHLAAAKFPTLKDLTPAGSKAAAKQDGKGAPAAKRAAGQADGAKTKKGKE
jgi:hypothetical protein